MAWTDVGTFAVGQVLDAATMNALRGNQNIGHRVCTSSTRPSVPDEGTMIYETDTKKVYVWDGSQWSQVSTETAPVAGSILQVGRYGWTNETSVNGSGAGWVNATNSSYSFTPRFSTSTIMIQFEWAMAPFNLVAIFAGMACRGLWGGSVVTVQGQTHEVYFSKSNGSGADLYTRTVKTASFTAGTTSPVTISTQVAAYSSTTNARLNQSNNWSSYYTVWEIAA